MSFLRMLLQKKAPEDPEIMCLTESKSDVETELILGIFRENGIPCYSKTRKAGSIARIYTGFSLTGCDILIRRSDEEQARALLAVIRSDDEAEFDGEGETDSIDSSDPVSDEESFSEKKEADSSDSE